jgi:hypothetical protein
MKNPRKEHGETLSRKQRGRNYSIELMVRDGNLLPIPPSLRHYVFQGFVDAPDKLQTADTVAEQDEC